MTYRVSIETIDDTGVPVGRRRVLEAQDEAQAMTLAVCGVDAEGREHPGMATVSDGKGHLVFSYTGRAAHGRR